MSWRDRAYHRDTYDHEFYTRVRGHSVTTWLLIINIAVFVIDALLGRLMGRVHGIGAGWLTDWGHFSASTLLEGQAWRVITFQFLHGDLLHIIFNMWALWFFGRIVESYLGSRAYLLFYLVCGVAGAALYMVLWGLGTLTNMPNIPFLLVGDSATRLVGASAGIFGLLMGAAAVAPHQQISLIIPPITLKLRTLAYILVGLSAFILMVSAAAGGDAAHLGGAVAGFFLIRRSNWLTVFERLPSGWARRRASQWQRKQDRLQRQRNAQQAEVDRILDKVRAHGLQSLTRGEKKTLQRATEEQRRGG